MTWRVEDTRKNSAWHARVPFAGRETSSQKVVSLVLESFFWLLMSSFFCYDCLRNVHIFCFFSSLAFTVLHSLSFSHGDLYLLLKCCPFFVILLRVTCTQKGNLGNTRHISSSHSHFFYSLLSKKQRETLMKNGQRMQVCSANRERRTKSSFWDKWLSSSVDLSSRTEIHTFCQRRLIKFIIFMSTRLLQQKRNKKLFPRVLKRNGKKVMAKDHVLYWSSLTWSV